MRPTPRCGGIKDPDAEDDDLDMKDVSPAEAAAEAAKAEGTSFTDAESMALITWVSKTNGKGWWEGTTSAAAKALKKEEAQSAVQTVRGVKRTVKQVVARWQNMRSTYNTIKQAMQKSGAAAYDGKNAWFVSMDILMTMYKNVALQTRKCSRNSSSLRRGASTSHHAGERCRTQYS